MNERQTLVRLSLQCTGLQLDLDSSAWKYQKTFLTSLVEQLTKSSSKSLQNKWWIVISQTRPGQHTLIGDVYRSELIEDPPMGGYLCPSLVAVLQYDADEECQIRIRICLSSKSVTGGKEITVCETTLLLSTVTREGQITKLMMSPLLKTEASLTLTTFRSIGSILEQPLFAPRSPINTRFNPLLQNYCFYREGEFVAPLVVYVEELALECRMTGVVPSLYLQSVLDALTRSREAWSVRREQEAIRQGRFVCLGDALRQKWLYVSVSVLGARIVEAKTSMANTIESRPKPPSTYVEIEMASSASCFTEILGYTNVEYNTVEPVYGSNTNAAASRKPPGEPQRGSDAVVMQVVGGATQFIRYVPDSHVSGPPVITFSLQLAEGGQRCRSSASASAANNTPMGEHLQEPQERLSDLHNATLKKTERLSILKRQNSPALCLGRGSVAIDEQSIPTSAAGENGLEGVAQMRKGSLTQWIPLRLQGNEYSEIELHVAVEIIGKANMTAIAVVDAAAGEAVASTGATAGVLPPLRNEVFVDEDGGGARTTAISACREWEWLCGNDARDPLDDPVLALPNTPDPVVTGGPAAANSAAANSAAANSAAAHTSVHKHCPYSLSFLDRQLVELDALIAETEEALENANELKATFFRSSASKKHVKEQYRPVNLHMQIFAVRDLVNDVWEHEGGNSAIKVLDAITCGCFSPHALGFAQKKGLDSMESSLLAARSQLDDCKRALAVAVSAVESPHLPSHGTAIALFEEISSRAMEYDGLILTAGRRKLVAMSQALSVAVSSVLMKLTLVAEGRIPFDVAVGWLLRGFLLTFEGLLSVIGNERFMLEDTVAAIESLNQYRVRVCVRVQPSGVGAGSPADVTMRGREVQLHLSADAMQALPPAYSKEGGAVLPLVAVLFNQGIDLHQSLALAASSLSAMATQAQANVSVSRSPSREALSKEGGAVPTPTVASDGVGRGSVEEKAAQQSLQHAINVRSLVRTLEYCQQLGDEHAAAAAALHEAASVAKESIDKYRLCSLLMQSMANGATSSATSSGNVGGGGRGRGVGGGSTISKAVNASKVALEMSSVASSAFRTYGARLIKRGDGVVESASTGVDDAREATLSVALNELSETILSNSNVISKNVDLLVAVERVCALLGGCRVTFCKSGKDRTGMAVTYEQSRRLGEHFNCGGSLQRTIHDANLMRVHGVRLDIAEKNIGRRNYSINSLQKEFMPVVYRPPDEVLENLLRKDDT